MRGTGKEAARDPGGGERGTIAREALSTARADTVISLIVLALLLTSMSALVSAAGCSARAGQYAREARSAYIAARAVLAEVKEFPSSMEELLRSSEPEDLPSRAKALIQEARTLLPEAASAFRAVEEKLERLRAEGGERFAAYADALHSLVDLNLQVVALYGEFVGLSGSVLEGMPYDDRPANLMPTLRRMDDVMAGIEELSSRISSGEEDAENIFRSLEE